MMECENCGREMVRRSSAKGEFWGCSGYPKCKSTKPLGDNEKASPQASKPLSVPSESVHQVVISKVEKPHSYEFGKANNRHKIYYAEIADLIDHIAALKNAGLVPPENLIDLEEN